MVPFNSADKFHPQIISIWNRNYHKRENFCLLVFTLYLSFLNQKYIWTLDLWKAPEEPLESLWTRMVRERESTLFTPINCSSLTLYKQLTILALIYRPTPLCNVVITALSAQRSVCMFVCLYGDCPSQFHRLLVYNHIVPAMKKNHKFDPVCVSD